MTASISTIKRLTSNTKYNFHKKLTVSTSNSFINLTSGQNLLEAFSQIKIQTSMQQKTLQLHVTD